MWRAMALGALVLACGSANAVMRVQPQPPVSSELPRAPQEIDAQRTVIEELPNELQQRQEQTPLVVDARIGQANPQANQLTLQTAQGPVLLQMPQDTQVRFGNVPVRDLGQLPEGKEVRASYGEKDGQVTLQLVPVNPPPREEEAQ